MPQIFKRLGAINSTANAQANLYVVPASNSAVVSTITICNQTAANGSYSLMVQDKSEFSNPAANATMIVRGAAVPAADTVVLTMGLTMNAGSILSANGSFVDISFSAFGSEVF
tara:strand:+ start:363 stop:701 length:339 start_codon:yes stop_codon:yes gene_type:complete